MLAGVLLALTCSPAQAVPDPIEVGETIRRSVEQLRSTGEVTVAGRSLRSAVALPEVYETRGFRPLWNDAANVAALLGEIAAIGGDGLDPADYHFDAIRAVLERQGREADSAAVATIDLLLTDALIRLAAHLHHGKLDSVTGDPRWDLSGTLRGESGAALVHRIATGSAVARQLGELRPLQPFYGRLKSALARYRVIEQDGGWEPLPAGRPLQLGMEDPRIPLLRRHLAAVGDFPGILVDSSRFEAALEDAVRRFQARHGLEADGVFGPASLRELNRPVEERLDQLRANLERARWLLAEVRGRFLLVDPAGERVVLMDNSQQVLAQGAQFTREARVKREFRTEMRYLVVNPDWVLPTRLVEHQVAPLAQRAPGELAARGMEVFNRAGEPVDASRADWSQPARLIVRQLPGPRSFLGPVRFPVPGSSPVSLHGRPAEGDALPGSIRLEDPLALAGALAGPASSWTRDELATALVAGMPRTLSLSMPLPVLFAPWTTWVETDGTVFFKTGFAERDAVIITGLSRSATAN